MAAVVANDPAWQPLCERFLALVDKSHGSPQWRDVWRLLVEDDWFRSELHRHAKSLLRDRLGRQQLRDLEHDALLELAQALATAPDLKVDSRLAASGFPAWMGTILRNCCLRAARPTSRGLRVQQMSEDDPPPVARTQSPDTEWDLESAIDSLSEPERSVLLLALEQFTLTEAAVLLDLSYKQVRIAWERGSGKVRAQLRSSR